MRVKNKITGKLANLTLSSDEKTFLIMEDDETVSYTAKLADLKDWEEYEEPKEYWHIDFDGCLMQTSDIKCDKYVFDNLKEIGNYFDTREEAEKAVEKLKAWKRLKDKGFKFMRIIEQNEGHRVGQYLEFELAYHFEPDAGQIGHDLDLLFGGEE